MRGFRLYFHSVSVLPLLSYSVFYTTFFYPVGYRNNLTVGHNHYITFSTFRTDTPPTVSRIENLRRLKKPLCAEVGPEGVAGGAFLAEVDVEVRMGHDGLGQGRHDLAHAGFQNGNFVNTL